MASIDGVRHTPFRMTSPKPPTTSGRSGFAVSGQVGNALGRSSGQSNVAGSVAGSAAGAAREVAPLTAGMLATLQEFGTEPPAERAARRQGMLLLRQLGLLQLSLLADGPDDGALDRVAGLTAALEEAMSADIDPGLRKLLRAFILRARLELARQNRSTQ